MSEDLYQILGVSKNATSSEIKKAYRKLAVTHHPDKGGDEDVFKKISNAYNILSDKDKKAQYDNQQGGFSQQGGFNHNSRSYNNTGNMWEEFFRKTNQAFDPFEAGRVKKGTSIQVQVDLTLEEIFTGVNKKIEFLRQAPCSSCKGNGSDNGDSFKTCTSCNGHGKINYRHGHIVVENYCHDCGGHGKIIVKECSFCAGTGSKKENTTIHMDIPRGVLHGWKVSAAGYGNHPIGAARSEPGDLFVFINQLEHDTFKRDGDNLIYELGLNYVQATLGAKVEIPMIDGKTVSFDISECTPSGKVFRLKTKGMPSTTKGADFYGDMMVVTKINIPTKLSDSERKIIQKLSKEENFKTT